MAIDWKSVILNRMYRKSLNKRVKEKRHERGKEGEELSFGGKSRPFGGI
jgi:hypothetical protein